MEQRVYTCIASCIASRNGCLRSAESGVSPGRDYWLDMAGTWRERADGLVKEYLPRGAGFDCGTQLDWDRSTPEKLVLDTSFHHMDEWGGYDGWTEHTIFVRASLMGDVSFSSISGWNRNDIKEYIADVLYDGLMQKIEWPQAIKE